MARLGATELEPASLVPTLRPVCSRGQAAPDDGVPGPAPRWWADGRYRATMRCQLSVRLFDPRAGIVWHLGSRGRPTDILLAMPLSS